MALTDVLWMTKPKLILLAIFLILTIPKYFNSNCPSGTCAAGALATACQCGFSIANFFTIFVIAYIAAGVIGEVYSLIRKGMKAKT